jgi:DegV family protein with EDD domain
VIKVVTDSTCYLPEDVLRQHDIHVVPLNVHFGQHTYREGVDLTPEQFYHLLAASPVLPTTSQPSPGEFRQVFAELSSAGYQTLCLVISSRLSGTYQSAIEAQQMLAGVPVVVFDSLSVAAGLALMVLTAAEMAAAGYPMEVILERLEQLRHDVRLYFIVDTLEYLQKGGRIGKAAALLGSLLEIKPILAIQDGIVQPLDRARSKPKAFERLLEHFEAGLEPGQTLQCILVHAQALNEAQQLAAELQRRFHCRRILTTEVGAVVGTHVGPGVVGAALAPIEDR